MACFFEQYSDVFARTDGELYAFDFGLDQVETLLQPADASSTESAQVDTLFQSVDQLDLLLASEELDDFNCNLVTQLIAANTSFDEQDVASNNISDSAPRFPSQGGLCLPVASSRIDSMQTGASATPGLDQALFLAAFDAATPPPPPPLLPVPAASATSSLSPTRGRGRPRKAPEDKEKPTYFLCRFCSPLGIKLEGFKSTEGLLHHMAEAHQLFPRQKQNEPITCNDPGCGKKFLRQADYNKHCRRQGFHKDWRLKPGFTYPEPMSQDDIGDTFGPKYGPMRKSLILGQEGVPGRCERKKGCLW